MQEQKLATLLTKVKTRANRQSAPLNLTASLWSASVHA